MTMLFRAALLFLASIGAAAAQDPVKVGFVTTLSGPGGYLGEDVRDGFLLAMKEGDGKLGGVPVQVLVEDDGLKPANAKQIVTRMLKTDHVRLFTGTIFTNVALAMLGDIIDSGAYWLGPNTSPDEYAGKDCAPNYFVTGWDETLHASAGVLANERGRDAAVPACAELPGRQADPRRGEARVQRQDRWRDLHQPRPDRLQRRDRADPRSQAGRGL